MKSAAGEAVDDSHRADKSMPKGARLTSWLLSATG